MTFVKCINGSFKTQWWMTSEWNSYLRCWIKKSAIGSLELSYTHTGPSSSLNALIQSPVLLVRTETEWIDPVRTGEEYSLSGIGLHVLPSRVRPSARHELKVFLWYSRLFLGLIVVAAWTHWSTSGLVSAAIVKDVITTVFLFSSVFHCCLSIYENLH